MASSEAPVSPPSDAPNAVTTAPVPHDGPLMASSILRHRRQIIPLILCLTACSETWSDVDRPQTTSVTTQIASVAAPRSSTRLTRQDTIERLTGGRTRAVWIRDLGDGTDILGFGDQVLVMGFDTGDTLGERAIVETLGTYAKPLLTPRGDRVVYTNRREHSVHVVDWSGEHDRRLLDGFPLAVWIDPDTSVEWVYVGIDAQGTDPESYGEVHRHPIDNPEIDELVWNRRAVSGDSFQLSRDGRLAGALARWPDAGVIELPNGEWRPLGDGCWTALAGDDSHLFWYFDGQHRNLTIVDTDAETDRRWTVNINGAPGIDGFEVYHPRWSNHPRFLTMTGPYAVGGADNKIRGGGHGVEIHVGRFSPDHTRVEAWIQVTANDAPDFYPDVWIDPTATVPVSSHRDTVATAGGTPDPALPASPIVVDARVTADVPVPTPHDIAPYRNGLLALEYEVLDVIDGRYDGTTLLAAHWIIRNATLLESAARPVGSVVRMRLEPYAAHAELEGERLVMDSDRFDLSLYYDLDTGS